VILRAGEPDMREITHLVLLGRVRGRTAKKGDIELSEHRTQPKSSKRATPN
jgi:hypothetical protein